MLSWAMAALKIKLLLMKTISRFRRLLWLLKWVTWRRILLMRMTLLPNTSGDLHMPTTMREVNWNLIQLCLCSHSRRGPYVLPWCCRKILKPLSHTYEATHLLLSFKCITLMYWLYDTWSQKWMKMFLGSYLGPHPLKIPSKIDFWPLRGVLRAICPKTLKLPFFKFWTFHAYYLSFHWF